MRQLSIFIVATGLAFGAMADTTTPTANGVSSLTATPVAETLPVWQPEAATSINFEVLRKGKPFGWHKVDFEQTDKGFQATADIELTAKFGPITAYKYRHDSVETWEGGKLVGLDSETRKDGKDLSVTASLQGDALMVEGSNFSGAYPAAIVPANHWNISQLYSDTMLSTEGGQPLEVNVEKLGRETLEIGGQKIDATKFKLVSDLTVNLWYDDTGRWVKLDFIARDQLIEYVLQELY